MLEGDNALPPSVPMDQAADPTDATDAALDALLSRHPNLGTVLSAGLPAGRYMLAFWSVDEFGRTVLHRWDGPQWNYDWFLRSVKMLEKQILAVPVPVDHSPGVPAGMRVKLAATEPANGQDGPAEGPAESPAE